MGYLTIRERLERLRARLGPERGRDTYSRVSKYRGVYYDHSRGKFRARINHGYKQNWLGRFSTAEEAARMYDRAAKLHFGESAKLNFPPWPEWTWPALPRLLALPKPSGRVLTRDDYLNDAMMRFKWVRYRTETGFQCGSRYWIAMRCGCAASECRGWATVPDDKVSEHFYHYGGLT